MAIVSIGGFYLRSKDFDGDESVSKSDELSMVGRSSTARSKQVRGNRRQIVARLRGEMQSRQAALRAGELFATDYQDWLHDWTLENKEHLPLPIDSVEENTVTLEDIGIQHSVASSTCTPEQLEARNQLIALGQERQRAIASFAHMAATDPKAYQDALHDWQEEHGKSLDARRHEILLGQSGITSSNSGISVDLPVNATNDMLRYKELVEERSAFFQELGEIRKTQGMTTEEWQETLHENEKDLTAMGLEISVLKNKMTKK